MFKEQLIQINILNIQFVSHELGKVKPDSEIYQYVQNKLGISKENIIFFDDSEINVKAAINFGIKSFLVQNPQEVRNILKEMKLI